MLRYSSAMVGRQQLLGLALGFGALATAWFLSGTVAAGNSSELAMTCLGVIFIVIVLAILRDWRTGVYMFLVWLLFEDLARKYLGNNMIIFFGKDALVGVTYLALFTAMRRRQAEELHPPFMLPLSLFFWLGLIQVFNPNSPSWLYGLLGLKLYFFYIPLMFVSYALLRTDADLKKFLFINGVLTGLVALLGVVQGVLGSDIMSPKSLAPELQALGRLTRYAPASHAIVHNTTSVFVSSGRFGQFIVLGFILGVGTFAYLILRERKKSSSSLALIPIGLLVAAAMLSGSRTAFVFTGASALFLAGALLWGAPWRWGQGRRLVKAVRKTFLLGALSLAALTIFFPEAIGPRWSFYSETLDPDSPFSETASRGWEYPMSNFLRAFTGDTWPYGVGIGTASLGVQYVSRVLGQPPPTAWLESGYGSLVLEMGIGGLALWLAWTLTLMLKGWQVLRSLKGTVYFPIAVSIFWYAFLLLFPFTFAGLAPYQNYVMNAYLWLLVGILFRLPKLAAMSSEFLPHPAQGAISFRHHTALPGRSQTVAPAE